MKQKTFFLFFFSIIILIVYSCGTRKSDKHFDARGFDFTKETLVIDIKDFGAKTSKGFDNTIAFNKAGLFMRQAPEKFWVINFEKGIYQYRNNMWLSDLRNFTLNGDHTSLQNVIVNPQFGEDCRPINLRAPQRNKDPIYRYHFNNGDYFDTIDDFRIKIKKSRRADQYNSGDLILLNGYAQQYDGFPPNPRYFEYNVIKSIDKRKGIIQLKNKISHLYDKRWEDYSWGTEGRKIRSGKPRILNLNKTDYIFPHQIEIRNITFLPNPNCSVADALFIPGEYVKFKNVVVETLFPTCNRKFEFIGGVINDYVEFDKMIDTVILEKVTIKRKVKDKRISVAQGATGVNYLNIKDCDIDGKLRVSPRNLVVKNTNFHVNPEYDNHAVIDNYNHFFPVNSISISAIEILSTQKVSNVSIIGYDNLNQIKLVKSAKGNLLEVADNKFNRQHCIRSLDYNLPIYSSDNKVFGSILELYKKDKNWILRIKWEKTIQRPIKQITWNQVKAIKVVNQTMPKQKDIYKKKKEKEKKVLRQLRSVNKNK